jgi:hypothetical protein
VVEVEVDEDDEAVEVEAADSVAPTSDQEVVAPATVAVADSAVDSAATAVDMEADTAEAEVVALARRAGGKPSFRASPVCLCTSSSLFARPGPIIQLCSSTFWRLHGRNSLCTTN